jgi:ribosomal protein L7/L12
VTVEWPTMVLIIFAAFSAGHWWARRVYSRPSAPERTPESICDEEILAEHFAGRKINALKLYRTRHDCGLKDAQAGLQMMSKAAGKP